MHADMRAVTIQSNKIVSNEVKDNQALLEPSYGKNPTYFLANPMFSCYKGQLKKGRGWIGRTKSYPNSLL